MWQHGAERAAAANRSGGSLRGGARSRFDPRSVPPARGHGRYGYEVAGLSKFSQSGRNFERYNFVRVFFDFLFEFIVCSTGKSLAVTAVSLILNVVSRNLSRHVGHTLEYKYSFKVT